ncbi:hypothetical protein OG439_15800 [Amycolatopsis sp. NBC_01307]|nr:hypothetical protein OG439_15800 [Amycolatopsis sp. NBC_01307]
MSRTHETRIAVVSPQFASHARPPATVGAALAFGDNADTGTR